MVLADILSELVDYEGEPPPDIRLIKALIDLQKQDFGNPLIEITNLFQNYLKNLLSGPIVSLTILLITLAVLMMKQHKIHHTVVALSQPDSLTVDTGSNAWNRPCSSISKTRKVQVVCC